MITRWRVEKIVLPGRWLIVVSVMSLFFVLALAYARFYKVGMLQDDALFIIGAKSLLTGSFSDLSLVGFPPLTNALPGWPLFLAPWVALAGNHLQFLSLIPMVLLAATGYLVWRLSIPFLSPPFRWFLFASFLLSPLTSQLSSHVIAEPLFVLLVCVTGILLKSADVQPHSRHLAWLAGCAAGAAGMVRPEGVAVGIALAVSWAGLRRWREFVSTLIAYGMVTAPFFFRNLRIDGHASGYSRIYLKRLPDLDLTVVAQHALRWLDWVFSNVLAPHQADPFSFDRPMWIVVGISIVVAGFLVSAREKSMRRGPVPFFLFLFTFLFCLIHVFWTTVDGRYVLPVLPFVLFFTLAFFDWVSRQGNALRRLALICLVGLGSSFSYSHQLLFRSESILRNKILPFKSYAEIKRKTEAGARFVCFGRSKSLWLYTSRTCVPLRVFVDDLDRFRLSLSLSKADFIFMEDHEWMSFAGGENPARREASLIRSIQESPDLFRQVYVNEEERVAVYRTCGMDSLEKAFSFHQLALEAKRRGDSQLARLLVDQALSQGALIPSALTLSGALSLSLRQDLAKGERHLRMAVRISPRDAAAWLTLGRLLSMNGRKREAYAALKKAFSLAKDDPFFEHLQKEIEKELSSLGGGLKTVREGES